jgi:tRNA splicing endonuclease
MNHYDAQEPMHALKLDLINLNYLIDAMGSDIRKRKGTQTEALYDCSNEDEHFNSDHAKLVRAAGFKLSKIRTLYDDYIKSLQDDFKYKQR